MKKTTISFRVTPQIARRLKKLAGAAGHSCSYLAAEAIEEYLNLHEWQVQAIREGIKQADAGKVQDFDKVKATWESLN